MYHQFIVRRYFLASAGPEKEITLNSAWTQVQEHAHMLQGQRLPSPQTREDRSCSKMHRPSINSSLFLVQGSTLPTHRVLPTHLSCSVGLLQPLAPSWLRLKTAPFCFQYLITKPSKNPVLVWKSVRVGGGRDSALF